MSHTHICFHRLTTVASCDKLYQFSQGKVMVVENPNDIIVENKE